MLAILVFDDREVQNRVVQLDRQIPAEELRRAAAVLNEQFRGRTLEQVRQEHHRPALGDARTHEPGHGRHHLRGAAGVSPTSRRAPTWSW